MSHSLKIGHALMPIMMLLNTHLKQTSIVGRRLKGIAMSKEKYLNPNVEIDAAVKEIFEMSIQTRDEFRYDFQYYASAIKIQKSLQKEHRAVMLHCLLVAGLGLNCKSGEEQDNINIGLLGNFMEPISQLNEKITNDLGLNELHPNEG